VFSFGAHIGAIKAIAVDENGENLATGGDDEYIKVYNLKTRKEKGELLQHQGSITSLTFYKSSHLMSTSQDSTVCIWRTLNWMCLHVLGGHKDAVTSVAIHPSGKMAFSSSLDRTLRLWNLVEGRCAYITKPALPKTAVIDRVEWSPSGSIYALVAGGTLQLYEATQTGKPVPCASHSQPRRINAAKFLTDRAIAFAGDDCALQILEVSTGKILQRVEGKSRIKDLSLAVADEGGELRSLLSAATSTGEIVLFEITGEDCETRTMTPALPGSSSRLTCVAVAWTDLDQDDVQGDVQGGVLDVEEGGIEGADEAAESHRGVSAEAEVKANGSTKKKRKYPRI